MKHEWKHKQCIEISGLLTNYAKKNIVDSLSKSCAY